MNRNQRRLGRMHQKRYNEHESKREKLERQERLEREQQELEWREKSDRHLKLDRTRHTRSTDIEEVLPPKFRRSSNLDNVIANKLDNFTTNKCCYVAPKQEDFGQLTEENDIVEPADKYQKILREQYGFDPLIPETINQLKELRKMLCNSAPKIENGSQWASDKKLSAQGFAEAAEGPHWQDIDNADDIDKYLGKSEGQADANLYLPENIHISDVPRIKIIAKKFSKFKKNNVELRKLDEKVVCVEYDVFGEGEKPREKLRAFFSIKPTYGEVEEQTEQIPPTVKNNFNISEQDLMKLNEKEIEIIDGKITENKTYLEDLKRILRRKQAIHAKKNKESLDLMSLYEMAKRESPPLDDQFSNTNFLSKAELQEMKDLILRKCASSVQGINRRTVKKDSNGTDIGVISQSIMNELLRESGYE